MGSEKSPSPAAFSFALGLVDHLLLLIVIKELVANSRSGSLYLGFGAAVSTTCLTTSAKSPLRLDIAGCDPALSRDRQLFR